MAIDGLDEVAELSASALAALDNLPPFLLGLVPSEVTDGLLGGVPRIQEVLGFDPAEDGALIQTGLDFSNPWGLSAVEGEVASGVLVHIPVLDVDKALGFVERILNASGTSTDWTEASGTRAMSIENGALLAPYDGYLTLVIVDDGNLPSAIGLYDLMVSGSNTFVDSASYRNISEAIGDEWSFVGVISEDPFVSDVPAWSSFGLGGVGLAVIGGDTELGFKGVIGVDESSSLRGYVSSIDGADTLGHRLPGEPVALSKFALNLGALVEMPELAMVLMLAESTGGLDVASLLNSQAGPFWSAVTGDGVSWNHVSLSETSHVEQGLEMVCPLIDGSMQSLSTGERFCVSEMLLSGVIDEALLIGTGEGALQALQQQGAPGYLSQLSSAQNGVSNSNALYSTVVNLNGVVDTVLAEPAINQELGMAGMLAIGALRSYVPDYLRMDMEVNRQTFEFTLSVENEDDDMPSGATAVAGAGLIAAMAAPYIMESIEGLDDSLEEVEEASYERILPPPPPAEATQPLGKEGTTGK